MTKKSVKIQLDGGLEARPIAVLVQVASQYESIVHLETEDKRLNAKSIMGMMSLGLGNGETVTIVCDGTDEEKALEGIEKFLIGEAS